MLNRLWFACILLIVFLTASARSDISPELLHKGNFSQPLSTQSGWALYGKHNPESIVRNETFNGDSALHIIDKDSAGEIGITQTVPAEEGKTYQAEVEIQSTKPHSTIGAFLQMRFLPSQKFEQVGWENIVPDSSWQNVTVRATAPNGTTQIQIFVYTHAAEQPDFFIKNVSLKSGFPPIEKTTIPDPIPPQYTKLKGLHLQTALVQNGKAVSAIVASSSGQYKQESQALQKVLFAKTGVSVPVISDIDAAVPLTQNIILLGNRSTNKALSKLYDLFYALTDLRYPGIGGYEVRSVSNPFGNGYNAIIIGGSDDAGVQTATQRFIKVLSDQKHITNSLSVGWLLDVKTGQKVLLPADGAGLMPTWQDSKSYGSTGYFGWNSISKNEALYYMTGDPQYAKEFLRLALPDVNAKNDIDRIDGERIENKNDPLGGPYHYNATRMILFWDLIEESPVFTDAERLKVTNAFSRQLTHRVDEWTGKHIYALTKPALSLGSRHDNYSALSMYTLARYFERDYPGPIWKHVLQASGDFYFAPLAQAKPWVTGENDNLFWYDTGLAPVLDYMILSGDHTGAQSGALDFLLKNQQVLWDGTSTDRNLSYAALDYLNKAAYLTNDGRWITYRERLPLDANGFRLDQSFWPDASLKALQPDDLLNKWTGWFLTPAQIASRGTGFTPQQSFENLSYRTAPDDTGDFILLDGMNGESRNPYHTFALLNLRVDGKTLLKGYLNQVRTTADGTVEPKVPLDAALQKYFSIGESTFASADVPNLPYCNWQRGVYLRAGKFALAIDKLKFKTNSQHFEAEFWWQAEGNSWKNVNGDWTAGDTRFSTADSLYTEILGNPIKQLWDGAVRQGEEKYFFSLVAPNMPQQNISGVRVAPNAAVFAAPETILVSTDNYKNVNAEVALRSEKYFFAENLHSAPGISVSSPIDIDWDNAKGILNINAAQDTKLILDLSTTTDITFDGKKIQVKNHQISISLTPGKHIFTDVFMTNALKSTFEGADVLLAKTPKTAAQKPISDVPENLPALTQSFKVTLPESITQVIAITDNSSVRSYAAAGKFIYALDATGKILRQFDAPTDVTKIHWWPQAQLLVAGTRDQKVLAFSPDGDLKWTFQSEMAPEVYTAGKTYWFNTAPGHGGIHGLDSGVFLNNQSQLFVGSACTLEILDANGKLIKRLPQFWGPPALFQLIPAADGSVNLLAARDITDNPSPHIINSKTLDPAPYGYNGVPSGYDPIGGWIDQRRMHFFYVDLNGDGKEEIVSDITGVWNRISTWDVNGNPLSSIYFGPGDSPYKGMNAFAPSLIRGTDVGDIDGDGKPEIVTALSNGLIVALDGNCRIEWSRRVNGVPSALKIMGKIIAVGQEDGTIIALDGTGTFLSHSKTNGTVNDLLESSANSVIAIEEKDIVEFKAP
jgi:hypothetical protein